MSLCDWDERENINGNAGWELELELECHNVQCDAHSLLTEISGSSRLKNDHGLVQETVYTYSKRYLC